jgi:hypothetical protein
MTRASLAVAGSAKTGLVQEGAGRCGAAGGVGVERLASGSGPGDGLGMESRCEVLQWRPGEGCSRIAQWRPGHHGRGFFLERSRYGWSSSLRGCDDCFGCIAGQLRRWRGTWASCAWWQLLAFGAWRLGLQGARMSGRCSQVVGGQLLRVMCAVDVWRRSSQREVLIWSCASRLGGQQQRCAARALRALSRNGVLRGESLPQPSSQC